MYRVLLVDDEILIREAISQNTKWEELGYELAGTCKNGQEAIEFLESAPVDLVLTDIYMPYVDGIELAGYIYEHCKDTRVVIISGYDEFEYAKKALQYRVVEYILKPVTAMELSELLTRIRTNLDETRRSTSSMKRIRGEYMSNFPVLRGRFLHQLVQGESFMSEEEIRKKWKIMIFPSAAIILWRHRSRSMMCPDFSRQIRKRKRIWHSLLFIISQRK